MPNNIPLLDLSEIAIQTQNGHYLTVINEGGQPSGGTPIETLKREAGDNETFTVETINQASATFALKTHDGHYLTAVNGGGVFVNGPVATTATEVSTWERLIVRRRPGDDKVAFVTKTGYYLTAVNGGGLGEAANTLPIHTDATVRSTWETFTLKTLAGNAFLTIANHGHKDRININGNQLTFYFHNGDNVTVTVNPGGLNQRIAFNRVVGAGRGRGYDSVTVSTLTGSQCSGQLWPHPAGPNAPRPDPDPWTADSGE